MSLGHLLPGMKALSLLRQKTGHHELSLLPSSEPVLLLRHLFEGKALGFHALLKVLVNQRVVEWSNEVLCSFAVSFMAIPNV